MVFSSITFIYYFLPLVLLVYFFTPKKYRNIPLLVFSLLFYSYGEPKYIILLIFSCIFNYIMGILITKNRQSKKSTIYLLLSILVDVGLLLYFKYTNFFIENINNIFNTNTKLLNLTLPLGISFFTFQVLGYIIDVYNQKITATKNIITFSTYVTLFPQLVAGPIVRYQDVSKELESRNLSIDTFGQGVERFIIGLGKKVLLANTIGSLPTILLTLPNKTVLLYILVAISYTLQIYFDFSGYSDMAIGLGKMLGFNFPENFNYPLTAKSLTDFWRRWHISLSSWLKDYIYIPLGGSRVNSLKHMRNIFIVWFITGFWHGASWNFIIWGLYFAIFLLIEKYFLKDFLYKNRVISHIYTVTLVIISFIIFNSNTLGDIIVFLKSIMGFNNLPFTNSETNYYLRSYFIIILTSVIASTPIIKNIINKLTSKYHINTFIDTMQVIYLIIILVVSTAYLIDSSYNPFLYFRF